MRNPRMVLRLIERDANQATVSILEQDVPATSHAVELFLRRAPFREVIAEAMLRKGTVVIERKERT